MKKTIVGKYIAKDTNGDYEFGNISSPFETTERYFKYNGEPCLPRIGEFHFSRYDCNLWEREIAKMKAE